MLRISVIVLVVLVGLGGCGSDANDFSIESKPMCLVDVAHKLVACANDGECEQGVARYAGYCYNEAPGSQMDICRGGQYFFEQPLQQMSKNHEVLANLDKRLREIIIRSGEVYCNYNFN